jgi:ABC-type antimicrobial peptide transport system permease subunit
VDVRSLDIEMADTLTTDRTTATLASVFVGLGLLLAALGVYGVLAHHLGRRAAEMGLRTALGASPSRVVRELFGRTAVTAALGLLAGAWLARAMSAWVQSLLFEVSATDPGVTVGAGAVLLAVALLAAWTPARRAARLDPVDALREV